MLEEDEIKQLTQILKRTFALPITKSTYNEIQRSIFKAVDENVDRANEVLVSLLGGEVKKDNDNSPDSPTQDFLDEFSVQVRLAKDIYERGEFLNFISSEVINARNNVLFSNFIHKLDGNQFQFLTDPEGIVQLASHFLGRVEEIKRIDKSKRFIKNKKEDLQNLKERLEHILED